MCVSRRSSTVAALIAEERDAVSSRRSGRDGAIAREKEEVTRYGNGRGSTDLLHDSRLPLGKSNVAARLVADELDLNLATLPAALLIIIVVVVGGRRSLALDTARLGGGSTAIALRLFELGRRVLLVLIRDVGHDESRAVSEGFSPIQSSVSHRAGWKRQKVVEILL